MIQKSNKVGDHVPNCPGCRKPPKHIHVRGAEVHFLECNPCDKRTARFKTIEQAEEAWFELQPAIKLNNPSCEEE